MDKTIVIALIAAGSAFAGVVGGGISNYLVNKKMESVKLLTAKKEQLYEQLNIIYHQTVKFGKMNRGVIEVDHSDELIKENLKSTNPLRAVDSLVNLYFRFLIDDLNLLYRKINTQNSITDKIGKQGLTESLSLKAKSCEKEILETIDRMRKSLAIK